MTRYWHTWVSGYRARIAGINKDHNWYEKVRPNTTDSIQWFEGWNQADNDIGKREITRFR